MTSSFALVDCNNFYVSCERAFNPSLHNKPVLILSNNDGCAIARSNEVKALGVKMGDPYFKLKDLIECHNIKIFSSNYELYGDMSSRVMDCLRDCCPHLEIYSIDEAFLDLSLIPQSERIGFATKTRNYILKCTGIPVSIGIAPTKTLAKIANKISKNSETYIESLEEQTDISNALESFRIQDIWGVGRQIAKKLNEIGIFTAKDFAQMDPARARKMFNVVVVRTIFELQGRSCLNLADAAPPKKSMISSRSFGVPVRTLDVLEQSLTFHASKLGERLRSQGLKAGMLSLFIHTNSFKQLDPQYSAAIQIKLDTPTQDTRVLIKTATRGLQHIFKNGFLYKKLGLIVYDLLPASHVQLHLFNRTCQDVNQKTESLLNAIDSLNRAYGAGSVRFASEGFKSTWRMRREMKSPSFTTRWTEILSVD